MNKKFGLHYPCTIKIGAGRTYKNSTNSNSENKKYTGLRIPFITIGTILMGLFFYVYSMLASTNDTSHFEAKINTFDEIIMPQLSHKPNNYKVFLKNSSLVPQANAIDELPVEASSYILTDLETGEILASKNKDAVLPVASLTKIMTAVVALDLAEANEKFVVTEKASRKVPTKIGAKPGQKLTLYELLEATLLTSANDAAQVIADGVDIKYNDRFFIKAMNEKAKLIGLENSSFSNPQGFDSKNNYSTVSDLAVLTHYAVKNYPEIGEISSKAEETLLENSDHTRFDLPNWNGLLGVYPSTIGLKIGNTEKAGKTTIVISNRGEKKLVAIVLGAPTIASRDLGAASLLDYGYAVKLGLTPVNVTEDQLKEKYATWYD